MKNKTAGHSIRFYIIGFMGSGKTYWGKQWAAQLRLPFYDLDTEIEKEFGMPVNHIFEQYGEEAFRQAEAKHLTSFHGKKNFLLSCGGGAPCFHDNMEHMIQTGTVVYLKATPDYLLKRVANEIEQRPLLAGLRPEDRLCYIENKLKEREPFYQQASIVIHAEGANENSLNEYLNNYKNA